MNGEPQEVFVDRLIREAMESGEFEDLPGAGKPIPGAGTHDDEGWWIREWISRNSTDEGSDDSSSVSE